MNQCFLCSDKRVYLVIFIVVNIELYYFPSFAVSDSTQTLHAAKQQHFDFVLSGLSFQPGKVPLGLIVCLHVVKSRTFGIDSGMPLK